MNIIMYHYVRPIAQSRYPGIKGRELEGFIKQLDYLEANYKIITPEDLLEAIAGGKTLPEKAVLLTFDDGYTDCYKNVFPILSERGLKGVFAITGKASIERKLLDVNKLHFLLEKNNPDDLRKSISYLYPLSEEVYKELAVPGVFDPPEVVFIKKLLQFYLPEELRTKILDELFAEFMDVSEEILAEELYMNVLQIRHMKREGQCIAWHGYDHRHMAKLTDAEIAEDIVKSKDCFAGIIDEKDWIAVYPYGSADERVISAVSKAGAVAGFTVEEAEADITHPMTLSRKDTNSYPTEDHN
jgi:peptidoglycan/xylan/chitin deacetylase (PgdA/CDA1 family)